MTVLATLPRPVEDYGRSRSTVFHGFATFVNHP